MQKTDKLVAKIIEKYFKTKKIKNGDTLLVALSGGSDSMCLFDIFYKLKSIYDFDLVGIHVHHGIRDKDADDDLLFVRKYCDDFNIKLIEARVDSIAYSEKYGLTLEEAARKLRYKEFDKAWKELSLINKTGNVYVLVAHHMKDQAETVIHNIIRGTGIKGLSGMRDENGYIKRPLLSIKKEEIEDYIKRYDIPYVIDKTNDDTIYTRNYIRKYVISPMEKLNDKVYDHIYELSNVAMEINDYIEMLSKYVLKKITIEKNSDHIIIDLMHFRNTSHIVQVYIVRQILENLVSTLKDITKKHIEDVIKLSMKEKGGHLDLPYNITVDKIKRNIIFSHNDDNISMKRKIKK